MQARTRTDLVVWLICAFWTIFVTSALAQVHQEGLGYEQRAAAVDTEILSFIEDAHEFRARAEATEASPTASRSGRKTPFWSRSDKSTTLLAWL
jgi:hypothetical protein